MRRSTSISAIALLAASAAVYADDAVRCLDLIQAERFDAARPVCRNLELSDPHSAQAFAYFELYGEIGRKRLQVMGMRGADEMTAEEKRTLESARQHFLTAAEAGSPAAQMLLAMTIGILKPAKVEVDGVKYDEEQTYWLKKAAEQGIAEANFQLGVRALSPLGTVLVNPEYLPYLERAAQLGDEEAARRLNDYVAAEQSAVTDNLDDPEALRRRAKELWSGPFGDEQEANRLMRLLADAGDEEAMYVAGRWAWPDDVDGARKYLGMAAEAGSDKAMISLGNWYACHGDADEAGRWFRKALAMGHPEARYALNELDEWGLDEWDCRII